MANAILNFHFDYRHPSLRKEKCMLISVFSFQKMAGLVLNLLIAIGARRKKCGIEIKQHMWSGHCESYFYLSKSFNKRRIVQTDVNGRHVEEIKQYRWVVWRGKSACVFLKKGRSKNLVNGLNRTFNLGVATWVEFFCGWYDLQYSSQVSQEKSN